MSIAATHWAMQQRVGDAGRKLVLIAIAQLADARHRAYPGVRYLADITEQPEADVRTALEALVAAGLIGDTGDRNGRNRRTVVWHLAVDGPAKHWVDPV